MKKLMILLLSLCFLYSCKENKTSQKETDSIAQATFTDHVKIAQEAYIFSLPLVIMDLTSRQFTSSASAGDMSAPVNTFKHRFDFPDASFRSVVRPNADTYYSSAILDLTAEPIVLSVPNTSGRYYMMPMLDAYTNVFASPGTRTTGNEAGNFLITGPGWKGEVPSGMKQIESPTNKVWIIGRTQVNSKEDGDKVVIPLQQKYILSPLSVYGKPYKTPERNTDKVPKGEVNTLVRAMSVEEYFNYVNQLLLKYPPATEDKEAMERFAIIGIKPGATFDLNAFTDEEKITVRNIPGDVFKSFDKQIVTPHELENGWTVHRTNVGTYGTDYNRRAFVSYVGLGANLPEDAMYPSCSEAADGKPLNGANKYILHFAKGQTPPSKAFWSLTMYAPDGYFVENPLNRYAIGDRSNLKTNEDGSIDIYLQHTSPGKDKESNWLPAPKGDFNILMRVYWPKEEMLNGNWKLPAVKQY